MGDERSAALKEKHREQISKMYFSEKKTQAEIAVLLGISQPTVSRDVRALEARWRERSNRNVSKVKEALLAELNQAKDEAWHGWQRSQQDAETVTKTTTSDSETITVKTEGQAGDPRFLKEVRESIALMLKAMGLEAVIQVDVTHQQVQIVEVESGK